MSKGGGLFGTSHLHAAWRAGRSGLAWDERRVSWECRLPMEDKRGSWNLRAFGGGFQQIESGQTALPPRLSPTRPLFASGGKCAPPLALIAGMKSAFSKMGDQMKTMAQNVGGAKKGAGGGGGDTGGSGSGSDAPAAPNTCNHCKVSEAGPCLPPRRLSFPRVNSLFRAPPPGPPVGG